MPDRMMNMEVQSSDRTLKKHMVILLLFNFYAMLMHTVQQLILATRTEVSEPPKEAGARSVPEKTMTMKK